MARSTIGSSSTSSRRGDRTAGPEVGGALNAMLYRPLQQESCQVRQLPGVSRPVGQCGWACQAKGQDYRAAAMVEPGLVTLAKIVGTLLLAMGIIPFIFLLSPGGDKNEPKDNFDDLV
jgi:hypothetical protein